MASMPFLGFTFLLCKNVYIYHSQHPAGQGARGPNRRFGLEQKPASMPFLGTFITAGPAAHPPA
jgi:hypothetical protein